MCKKIKIDQGFILADALVTLWIVSLFIIMYCSIDSRVIRQENSLIQKVELSSRLLSKSNELITAEENINKKSIEAKNGEQTLSVEIKK